LGLVALGVCAATDGGARAAFGGFFICFGYEQTKIKSFVF
jgi:hypothetical protein